MTSTALCSADVPTYAASDGNSDGNIRYYEYENDSLHFLNEYKSSEPRLSSSQFGHVLECQHEGAVSYGLQRASRLLGGLMSCDIRFHD